MRPLFWLSILLAIFAVSCTTANHDVTQSNATSVAKSTACGSVCFRGSVAAIRPVQCQDDGRAAPPTVAATMATQAARSPRIWRGRTRRDLADTYEAYSRAEGIPPLQKTALGVQLFRKIGTRRLGSRPSPIGATCNR